MMRIFTLVIGVFCVLGLGCTSKNSSGNDAAAGGAGTAGGAGGSAGFTAADGASGGSAGVSAGSGGISTTGKAGDGSVGIPTAGTSGGGSGASGTGGTSDSGGSTVTPDAGDAAVDSAVSPPGTVPIDPPVKDDCITDVSAGDHSFKCSGSEITYMVMVDQKCTQFACGLIFDVHGAMMSGDIMRTNDQLHILAPPKGYLTVHPTSPTSSWAWETDPQALADFMSRMIKAFHVDEKRIHMTGFSMGAAMTYWFLCNRNEVLASAAPVTGSSADQVTNLKTNTNCIQSIDSTWQPRVPMLVMNGTQDGALTIDVARARVEGIVTRLGLTGGNVIDSGNGYTRKRWEGEGGMVLDFLEHDFASSVLAGHCIPGGPATDAIFACAGATFKWGEVVLQWFMDHPKK